MAAHSKKSTIHAARPDSVTPPLPVPLTRPIAFSLCTRGQRRGSARTTWTRGAGKDRWAAVAVAVTRSTSPSPPATRALPLPLRIPADCAPFLVSTHHRLMRVWRGGGTECRPRGERCEGRSGREGGRGAQRRAGGASLGWILGAVVLGLVEGCLVRGPGGISCAPRQNSGGGTLVHQGLGGRFRGWQGDNRCVDGVGAGSRRHVAFRGKHLIFARHGSIMARCSRFADRFLP